MTLMVRADGVEVVAAAAIHRVLLPFPKAFIIMSSVVRIVDP